LPPTSEYLGNTIRKVAFCNPPAICHLNITYCSFRCLVGS
jgi:hypothetical protein